MPSRPNEHGAQKNTTEFNVFDDAWIPVLDRRGNQQLVSVSDAFARAHELRWIDTEAPVMTAAVHRLLIAFALRIYGPEDASAWRELWQHETFPEVPLVDYRKRYGSRFDLFDPHHPFLQCPDLPREKMGSTAQLVFGQAVGSAKTLFDHTLAHERPELSPAAAARWLVTLHAYDSGGLKTPATMDKSSQRGPANYLALALAEGATLKDTLLLNLVPGVTDSQDRPPWEHEDPPFPEPVKGRSPRGWVDMLTWPSRRALLNPTRRGSEVVVDRVVITPGDQMPRDADLPATEQMAGRRAKRDANGQVLTTTKPITLDEPQKGWRDAADLLITPGRPGTLDHIATHVPSATRCTLRVFGQQLDPYGGSIKDWRQESLPAPVSLLQLPREHWAAQLLRHALWLSDQVGKNVAKSENGHGNSRSTNAQVRYWFALSTEFTTFLRGLDGALTQSHSAAHARSQAARCCTQWRDAVLSHADSSSGSQRQHSRPADGRQIVALAKVHVRVEERGQQQVRSQYDHAVAALTESSDRDDELAES